MGMENIFWIIFDNELKEQYGDWKALLATNPNITASDFSAMLALDDKMRADLELLFKIASRLNISIYDWNDLRVFCTGIRDDIWGEGFQLLFDIRHIQDMILKIDLAEYWRLPILPNYQGQGLNFFRMIDRNQSIQTFTYDKQEENDVLIDEYPFED